MARRLNALPGNVIETRYLPFGIYRGLRFGVVLHPRSSPDVYLEGAAVRQAGFLRDHQGPRAILNAIERLAGGYGPECVRIQQDLAIAETQLRDYKARLGKPFLHEEYFVTLTALRDQLKSRLTEGGRSVEDELGASVCELAQSIQDLKARQSIGNAPQRIGRSSHAAEVPVTVRILRGKRESGGELESAETSA